MTTYLLAACVLVVLVLAVSRFRRDDKIAMPPDGSRSGAPDTVESLMLEGRKIEAIKLLREETGLGLKEAKEEVELRQRRLRTR